MTIRNGVLLEEMFSTERLVASILNLRLGSGTYSTNNSIVNSADLRYYINLASSRDRFRRRTELFGLYTSQYVN